MLLCASVSLQDEEVDKNMLKRTNKLKNCILTFNGNALMHNLNRELNVCVENACNERNDKCTLSVSRISIALSHIALQIKT